MVKQSCETRKRSNPVQVSKWVVLIGVMHQKGEAKLQFDNLPEGTNAVNIFHKIYSQLLSGGTYSRKANAP